MTSIEGARRHPQHTATFLQEITPTDGDWVTVTPVDYHGEEFVAAHWHFKVTGANAMAVSFDPREIGKARHLEISSGDGVEMLHKRASEVYVQRETPAAGSTIVVRCWS